MDALFRGVAVAIVAGLLLFVFSVLGAAMGAICGWAVGLAFGDTMRAFFGALGLGHLAPWQIGAMLGFVGSFFRAKTNTTTK